MKFLQDKMVLKKKWLLIIAFVAMAAAICGRFLLRSSWSPVEIMPEPIRMNSVRFDPSYFYDKGLKVKKLARGLSEKWKRHGVTTVFFRAYDPAYGAFYRTSYRWNRRSSFGEKDLLRHVIRECHRKGIKVFAWFEFGRHKGAWLKHPEWRVRRTDGTEYSTESNSYFLCPRSRDFRKWWLGFIADCLHRYPELDGVDIGEPVITWGDSDGCHCENCRKEFARGHPNSSPGHPEWRSFQTDSLMELISETCGLVRRTGKKVCVTFVVPAESDGSLAPVSAAARMTGFDLGRLLNDKNRPDIICPEFVWQQWATIYGKHEVFNPDWVKKATEAIVSLAQGKTKVVAHIELTDFDDLRVDLSQFARSIEAGIEGGADGVDFYSASLADKKKAWRTFREASRKVKTKRVLVLYDSKGLSDARQIAALTGHFHTETLLLPVGEYESGLMNSHDATFYVGFEYNASLPDVFLEDACSTDHTLCWLNYNIWQMEGKKGYDRYGLTFLDTDASSTFDKVVYKGVTLTKKEPNTNLIQMIDPARCRVYAWAKSADKQFPYILRTGNFWYVADLPTSFAERGSSYFAFSDVLHDVLREDHRQKHLALIRIEDVHPLTDTRSLKKIADYLHTKKVSFLVSLVPFYADPASQTFSSLSEQPEFVNTIKHMVAKGGSVVLHGCTHQVHGETGADFEFWDALSGQPLENDSEEYVSRRVERGIEECVKNGIHPLAWETPHYAATQTDYAVIAKYFSTAVERKQSVDEHGTDQMFPYVIMKDLHGQTVLPENLGYVPLNNQNAEEIVSAARKMRVVRDGVAGVFFHPFIKLDVLKEIIEETQRLGYRYIDIRDMNNRVASKGVEILTGSTRTERGRPYTSLLFNPRGRLIKSEPPASKKSHKRTTRIPSRHVLVLLDQDSSNTLLAEAQDQGHSANLRPVTRGHGSLNEVLRPVLLREDKGDDPGGDDSEGIVEALCSVGVEISKVSSTRFSPAASDCNLVIIPYAVARNLLPDQVNDITNWVAAGGNIICEGLSALSTKLGIEPESGSVTIQELEDTSYPGIKVRFPLAVQVQKFTPPRGAVAHYVDKRSRSPIFIGGDYGEGKFLYSGRLADGEIGSLYPMYPHLMDVIHRQFELSPMVVRQNLEIYFDPGLREDISVEDLVKMWQRNGVRTIYVAGWHIYPEWTYEYERLIELAHSNAMLVYVWLELPMVSEMFWDQHPEWREKNVMDQDARPDWRFPMALTDPECRSAVLRSVQEMLLSYDWDGVNVANFDYGSEKGRAEPDSFMPMHISARKEFEAESGFDPALLFDSSSQYYWQDNEQAWQRFEQYRSQKLTRLYHDLLGSIHKLVAKEKKEWEIVVTSLRDLGNKQKRRSLGLDLESILALGNDYPFTFGVENRGAPAPGRDARADVVSDLGLSHISPKDVLLAIHRGSEDVARMDPATTEEPTGTELFEMLFSCGGRAAIYSEADIYGVDFPFLSHAMARNAREVITRDSLSISAPHTVKVSLDRRISKNVYLDGELWPGFYSGDVLVPAGKHRITSRGELGRNHRALHSSARIVDMSGEIKSARVLSRGVAVHYESELRNILLLNKRPRRVKVDGRDFATKPIRGLRGYAIVLPRGEHHVEVVTDSAIRFAIGAAGVFLSTAIVGGGVLAAIILSGLYISVVLRRGNDNQKEKG